MKVLHGYRKIVDWMNYGVGVMIAVLLLIMTVLITWQVFARFVMGNPLRFSEELARFAMIWLTLLGAAYAFRKGSLISVDVIHEWSPPIVRKILNLIAFGLSAVFAFILVRYGFEMATAVSNQTGPSTGISMFWPNLAIPLAGIMIVLNSVALIIDELIGKEETA